MRRWTRGAQGRADAPGLRTEGPGPRPMAPLRARVCCWPRLPLTGGPPGAAAHGWAARGLRPRCNAELPRPSGHPGPLQLEGPHPPPSPAGGTAPYAMGAAWAAGALPARCAANPCPATAARQPSRVPHGHARPLPRPHVQLPLCAPRPPPSAPRPPGPQGLLDRKDFGELKEKKDVELWLWRVHNEVSPSVEGLAPCDARHATATLTDRACTEGLWCRVPRVSHARWRSRGYTRDSLAWALPFQCRLLAWRAD